MVEKVNMESKAEGTMWRAKENVSEKGVKCNPAFGANYIYVHIENTNGGKISLTLNIGPWGIDSWTIGEDIVSNPIQPALNKIKVPNTQ